MDYFRWKANFVKSIWKLVDSLLSVRACERAGGCIRSFFSSIPSHFPSVVNFCLSQRIQLRTWLCVNMWVCFHISIWLRPSIAAALTIYLLSRLIKNSASTDITGTRSVYNNSYFICLLHRKFINIPMFCNCHILFTRRNSFRRHLCRASHFLMVKGNCHIYWIINVILNAEK